MRGLIPAVLLTVCLSLPAPAQDGKPSQPAPITVNGALGAQLDLYFTQLSAYGFSGTVLVAKDGRLMLHKGYGLADRERNLPNTIRTIYDVASLAKQLTATAILKLESQGKLKTSDPISKYLPEVPADKRSITLHHLLTHTSGLPFECAEADAFNRSQFIKCMLEAKLNAEPGRRYDYSNAGYSLLAAIIEIVSGQSYEAFLHEQLFKPAGMSDTGFNGEAGRWQEEVIAHGYDESVDRGAPQRKPITWKMRGAWGLSTSVKGLYQWEQALRRNLILPQSAAQRLITSHVATSPQGNGYGYGWAVTKTKRGTALIEHDGVTFDGFSSIFQRYIDDDVVVIAASNRFFGRFLPIYTLVPAVAGIIFNSSFISPPEFIALDPKLLDKYGGVYELPSGAKLMVKVEGDGLVIGAEGQGALNLLAAVDGATGRLLEECNARTAKVINGISREDYAAISQAFANQMAPERAKEIGRAWLGRLERQHGPLRSVELLGTHPEREIARTYVRLNFERGVEIRRFRWENGFLGNIIIGTLPILSTTFRPQSPTDFTGFHLGIAKPVRISFAISKEGAVTALKAHTPAGELTARKTQ